MIFDILILSFRESDSTLTKESRTTSNQFSKSVIHQFNTVKQSH